MHQELWLLVWSAQHAGAQEQALHRLQVVVYRCNVTQTRTCAQFPRASCTTSKYQRWVHAGIKCCSGKLHLHAAMTYAQAQVTGWRRLERCCCCPGSWGWSDPHHLHSTTTTMQQNLSCLTERQINIVDDRPPWPPGPTPLATCP
jgi:hypothetical protein